MFTLGNLTISGNQTSAAILGDGSTVNFTFIYRAAVQRWTVDVSRQGFEAKGIGLSTHPNLLRSWRNIIPFGLQVVTVDGTDPFMADDLVGSQGTPARVIINILDGTGTNTDLDDAEAVIEQ